MTGIVRRLQFGSIGAGWELIDRNFETDWDNWTMYFNNNGKLVDRGSNEQENEE